MEKTQESIPVRLNLTEFLSSEEVALEGRIENLDDSKEYMLMRFDTYDKIDAITEFDQNTMKKNADTL